MRVSKVAEKLNVSADTVRYYTRIGILCPSRSGNGYKDYSDGDIRRLRFAIRAKALGFSLVDIKSIVDISERGKTPCPIARDIILKNLNKIRKSAEESLSLFQRMEKAVAIWEGIPDQVPNGYTICTLIENWEQEINHE